VASLFSVAKKAAKNKKNLIFGEKTSKKHILLLFCQQAKNHEK
jgi:hypothetical protein